MVTTSFVTSVNASPGRFYAVNTLKVVMSLILLRYDIKTEKGVRPVNWEYQSRPFPDFSANILFKSRQLVHVD